MVQVQILFDSGDVDKLRCLVALAFSDQDRPSFMPAIKLQQMPEGFF